MSSWWRDVYKTELSCDFCGFDHWSAPASPQTPKSGDCNSSIKKYDNVLASDLEIGNDFSLLRTIFYDGHSAGQSTFKNDRNLGVTPNSKLPPSIKFLNLSKVTRYCMQLFLIYVQILALWHWTGTSLGNLKINCASWHINFNFQLYLNTLDFSN